MSDRLSELLEEKDILLGDGGMGTSLFEMGLANGAAGELWNLEHPDRIEGLHRRFIDAGSDIVLTNTFGANAFRFMLHGSQDKVREINIAAARIARKAAQAAGRPVVVAGSMGPSGEMLIPLGEREPGEVEEAFIEQAEALKEGGADVAWIETMFVVEELGAAVNAARKAGLPYVMTMTFDTSGRTMMGLKPEDAVKLPASHDWHPIAFGANCGVGPAQLLDSVIALVKGAGSGTVIVAKGNCGIPYIADDMKIHYSGTPEIMADYACLARDAGARIVGGCCGTTPAHIAAMREALAGRAKAGPPGYDKIEKILGPVKVTVDLPATH